MSFSSSNSCVNFCKVDNVFVCLHDALLADSYEVEVNGDDGGAGGRHGGSSSSVKILAEERCDHTTTCWLGLVWPGLAWSGSLAPHHRSLTGGPTNTDNHIQSSRLEKTHI